jgi:hypothetical protein
MIPGYSLAYRIPKVPEDPPNPLGLQAGDRWGDVEVLAIEGSAYRVRWDGWGCRMAAGFLVGVLR